MPKLLRLDLQYFSGWEAGEDGVVRGGYIPEAPTAAPDTNPLAGNEPSFEPDPAAQPEPTPTPEPEVPTFDFGGRIVNPNDPASIAGAYEDFQNSQRFIQQLQQQNQVLAQQQQFQQAPQQPEPQENPFDVETFTEQFYEDPIKALDSYAEQKLEARFKELEAKFSPIIEERNINNEIQSLQAKHPDFQEHVDGIRNLIEQFGEDYVQQVGGLENAFFIARGQQAKNQFSLEEQLQDPNTIQQLATNEAIRNMVLQQQMSQKQESRPPVLMTNHTGGGQVNLAQQARPKSIAEASRLLKSSWGL